MDKWSWCRLERPSTASLMTLKLPEPMAMDEAEFWLAAKLPGWELICMALNNPDTVQYENN
jgi:hypothetical protein